MPRLPTPGLDVDNWGTLLNEYLLTSHREDGSLRGTVEVVNVRDFGAKGDNLTNDLPAIQAALQAAAEGSVLYFPPGTYILEYTSTAQAACTEVLLVNKLVQLRGAGAAATHLISRINVASPEEIDIIRLAVPGYARFMSIEALSVYPTGRCRHVINVDVRAGDEAHFQQQANFRIEDCGFVSSDNNCGYAIYLANTHSDGFFAAHIHRNFIMGGIYLNFSGDSVWITHNQISDQPTPSTGQKTGITLSNDVGAVSSLIAYNNITAYGGAINIIRGGETKILYNQLEARRTYHTGVNQALVSIQGDETNQCFQIDIIGNNINPNQTVDYALYIDRARTTVVENNLLVKGNSAHVKLTENALETRLGFNSWIDSDAATWIPPVIAGAGRGTFHQYVHDQISQLDLNTGSVVDTEARTTINALLAVFESYGILKHA
jgi:hypothetical protein